MKSTSTYTTMMRVTPEGRPFANDLHDIFAAMIFQIKVGDHRSLFRTYPASFTTDNMIEVLDHLQFTHVLRQPDPHDPHKQLETKTITTFSMTRTMAKQLGQHFLTARLIENASDPSGTRTMKDRSIWTVTSKGKWMVYNFAERGHVAWNEQSQTSMALKVIPDRKVVLLDRRDFVHPSSSSHEGSNNILRTSGSGNTSKKSMNDMDAISFERPNMTEAFKSMMEHLETSQLLADDVGGIGTQQMVTYTHTFFGYHVVEYIMQFMSVVNRNEADMVASEFVLYGWISQVLDKSDRANSVKSDLQFKSQRNAIYALTDRGRQALGWEQHQAHDTRLAPPPVPSSASSSHSNSSNSKKHQQQPHPHQHSLISDAASTISSSSIASFASSASSASNSSTSPLHQQHHQKKSDSMHQRQSMAVNTSSLWLVPTSGTDAAASSSTPSVSPTVVTRSSSMLMPLTRSYTSSSHYTRLQPILEDPLLRMYFREFLKQNFCEENLHFWVDYRNMLYHHQQHQKASTSSTTTTNSTNTTSSDKENATHNTSSSSTTTTDYNRILSECYAMYAAYLAPEATMELNIDHVLHQDIIRFVAESFKVINGNTNSSNSSGTSASHSSTANGSTSSSTGHIGEKRPQQPLPFFYTPTHPSQEQQTIIMVTGHRSQCLKTILAMYERVHDQICRIMAEDSLPRFLKSPRYVQWQQRQLERQQELDQQRQEMEQSPSPSEGTCPRSSNPASPMDSTGMENLDETSASSPTTTATMSDKKKSVGNNNSNRGKDADRSDNGSDDDKENADALHKELDRLTLTAVATTATTTTTTTPMTQPQPTT